MFHRDVSECNDLCPPNRLCQIDRSRRRRPPRSVNLRHATRRGRTSVCAAVFVAAALSGCSSSEAEVPGSATTASDGTVTVTVLMKDMTFDPAVIAVEPGTHLVVEAKNTDSMPHDLVFENEVSSELLPKGASATLDLGVIDADLDGWCSVSGHRAAGMTLTIEVAGQPG